MSTIETPGPARLPVIDSLRALALWGVIAMNIMSMVMALDAAAVIEKAGPADFAVAAFDLILVQGKARSVFAFLFGVGFGLLMSRTGPGFVGFYLRRMAVLLAIGLFNLAFLFWGDILILYALLGMVLMLFRRWSDRSILTLGLVLTLAPPLLAGAIEAITGAPIRGLSGLTSAEGWRLIEARAPIYAEGSYLQVVAANLRYYVDHNLHDTAYVLTYDLGVLGLFLLGLWTARKGVFADIAAWRPRLRRIAWICLPIGFVLSAVHGSGRMGIEAGPLLRAAVTAAYVGLPVMAMGYAALFTLWLSGKGKWLQRGLTPMGRMALTGYLASNLIGGFIWYGWGLGLMGQINVAGMAAIGLAIFVALCVFSAVWLKLFPQGPAEALWRRLSGRRSRPV